MKTIFDFSQNSNIEHWKLVNDGVMGGCSKSSFYLTDAKNAIFDGTISLENNGGFSSVHYSFEQMDMRPFKTFQLKLKGDGKTYQFRTKRSTADKHAYVALVETTGEWQTITIAMEHMVPQYRGEQLPMTNYAGDQAEQITILFKSKKVEDFKLEIKEINVV
ncbi:CIA30 family protein [Flavimarina sp. Hel_I_48]|uniref:CIA30 family protein n=1 Tax=Flavimarina sp. Hel_I_48 TaxID=1392488 RepID=UPI0004DF214A|nr:CIA30 family protein [Flavimarina sp. Hel_I_48]